MMRHRSGGAEIPHRFYGGSINPEPCSLIIFLHCVPLIGSPGGMRGLQIEFGSCLF